MLPTTHEEAPASLEERQQHREGVVGNLKVTWVL